MWLENTTTWPGGMDFPRCFPTSNGCRELNAPFTLHSASGKTRGKDQMKDTPIVKLPIIVTPAGFYRGRVIIIIHEIIAARFMFLV